MMAFSVLEGGGTDSISSMFLRGGGTSVSLVYYRSMGRPTEGGGYNISSTVSLQVGVQDIQYGIASGRGTIYPVRYGFGWG